MDANEQLVERSPIPEIFLLLLTHSTSLPPLIPCSSLQPSRIISVEFHSLSSPFWDQPELTNAARSLDNGYDDEYDEVSATYAAAGGNATPMSAAQQAGLQHPCSGMKKYLESGSFFLLKTANGIFHLVYQALPTGSKNSSLVRVVVTL